jgi:hypothetical protein
MSYKLKILHGALDQIGEHIVLRGVIDPATYSDIKIGSYQREEGTVKELAKLLKAIRTGEQLPDVEIGIRGQNFNERDGVFYIPHDCYMVDGLQRLTACKRSRIERTEHDPRLGALLHFGSTEAWERERFKTLNLFRRKVSPNILLRNEVDSASVQALLSMSAKDKAFVLHERVCWRQKMNRGEVLTALTVMKTVGRLHTHWGPGRSSSHEQLVQSIDKTMEVVGVNNWRANVRTFFDTIDQAFGVRVISFRDLSPHVKTPFLFALSEMYAEHQNFWEGSRLTVADYEIAKLKQFPIRDPGIAALISGGNQKGLGMLYSHLVDHMNRGRRTRQLTKWNGQKADGVLSLEGQEGFADSETSEEAEAS